MFKKLFTAFEKEGESLFYVGGFVRDKLRHDFINDPTFNKDDNPLEMLVKEFEPNDVDFTTSAHPKKIMKILRKNKLKVIPIGVEFGTVQTVIDGMKVEITTFRCNESYKKGNRKPAVKFGKTIEEDLARRDLTINSMAMDKDFNLIDPFSGYHDLIAGLLVTPIDPKVSFSDDPLRMLRVCRFQARGFGKCEWGTGNAMVSLSHKIKEVSSERIFEEVSKILMSDKPSEGLRLMVWSGLMNQIFPEVQKMVDFKNDQFHHKNLWEHVLRVVDNAPKKIDLKFAALFHDVGKPKTFKEDEGEVSFIGHESVGAMIWNSVAHRLKVSRNFRNCVNTLIFEHSAPTLLVDGGVTDKGLRRFIKRIDDKLDNLFHLSLSDITSHNPNVVREKKEKCLALKDRIDKLIEQDNIVQLKLPKFTGNVVMNATGLKGSKLGKMMKRLEQGLIDGDFSVDSDFGQIAKDILNKEQLW
jgi:poly(A) polymerase